MHTYERERERMNERKNVSISTITTAKKANEHPPAGCARAAAFPVRATGPEPSAILAASTAVSRATQPLHEPREALIVAHRPWGMMAFDGRYSISRSLRADTAPSRLMPDIARD